MTNVQAAALLIGIFMPFIITVIKQAGLNRLWNLAIAVIACGAAGALTMWASGGFSHLRAANLLGIIALVFIAAQAAYVGYWKGTDAEKALNDITSIKKAAPTS